MCSDWEKYIGVHPEEFAEGGFDLKKVNNHLMRNHKMDKRERERLALSLYRWVCDYLYPDCPED